MEDRMTSILLATDGSGDAALAARAAVDLSRKTGAGLHVVHAWHTVPSPHFEGWINAALEQEAREVLDEQVRAIEGSGGTVSGAHLRKASPYRAILDLASETDADLIVMGSRGLGAVKRILLGSVSEEVIQRARCPVLVMRGGDETWPPARVIVGEDSSGGARRAGEFAARIARLFGAEMVLVHVIPRQWTNVKPRGAEPADEAMRRMREHLEERAGALEGSYGRRPEVRTVLGYPALTLAEISEGEEATLLAVGSRGLNAVKRTMLGSVSSNVLRAAGGPVLVVPPEDPGDRSS